MTDCITESDIANMLAPISSDSPALGDLREIIAVDSSYQALRTARTLARNNERAAQNEGRSLIINSKDWDDILSRVPEVLADESKDIEMVAWYIEALTRHFGFMGLAKGFSLARQLIENYGDQLYPIPDSEGAISQLSALVGLNGFGSEGALIYPIKSINITQGEVPGPLAVWKCEQILEADRITDAAKREARFKQAGITRSQFDEIISDTPDAFFRDVHQQINNAIEEYEKYQNVLDDYCKDDPLPTGQILDALNNCKRILLYVAGDALVEPKVFNDDKDINNTTMSEQNNIATGEISDREDALKRLREIALFFRRTELHSPISYSIEQAIRWSNLPLTELIKELIPDEAARSKYQHLSGIGSAKDNQ